jgi:PhnB protein
MSQQSSLNPYLIFNGRCEEALEFYRAVFGSEILFCMRFEEGPEGAPENWKKKIMHACMEIHGVKLMASDTGPGMPLSAGNNFSMMLSFDSVPMMEERFHKLAEGGEVKMKLQDTFWGARFGMLTDRFGVHWMFSHQNRTN